MKNFFKRRTLSEVSADFAKKIPPPPKNTIKRKREMKAILEFNLPEDKVDFDLATKAYNLWHVCWQMDQYLRKEIKYNDDRSKKELKLLQEVREEFNGFMIENNIDLHSVE